MRSQHKEQVFVLLFKKTLEMSKGGGDTHKILKTTLFVHGIIVHTHMLQTYQPEIFK